MSDIDPQRLYERIKSVADQLVARDDHFTRADLAYELRGDGISGDSSEVSRLVWEAYRSLGNDPHIREAFLNNSSSKSLVDEYRIIDLIESGKVDYVVATSVKGRHPELGSVHIRRTAVERAIPCLTSIDTASALLRCLEGDVKIENCEMVDINTI